MSPEDSAETIKQAKLSGRQIGVCVDSSIYVSLGLRLNHGFFAALARNLDANTTFLLPDVLQEEIRPKLRVRARALLEAVRKSAIEASEFFGEKAGEPLAVHELSNKRDASRLVDVLWSEHLSHVSAHLLTEKSAVADEVMRRYFEAIAPFSEQGSKKAEFPDAFCLLMLRNWARSHDALVLAVSTDGDWQRYCAADSRFIFFDSLWTAVAALQNAQELRAQAIQNLAVALEHDLQQGRSVLCDTLRDLIAAHFEDLPLHADAHSGYAARVDVSSHEVHIEAINFEIGEVVSVVELARETATIILRPTVTARIDGYLDFFAWDSDDRQYEPVGYNLAQVELEVPVEAVVTLSGFPDDIAGFEVTEFSLNTGSITVDFGEVRPSWKD